MIRRERGAGRDAGVISSAFFFCGFLFLFCFRIAIFLFVQKRSSVLAFVPPFVSESLESPTRSGKCLETDGLTQPSCEANWPMQGLKNHEQSPIKHTSTGGFHTRPLIRTRNNRRALKVNIIREVIALKQILAYNLHVHACDDLNSILKIQNVWMSEARRRYKFQSHHGRVH